jgi:hypothetical protein
MSGNKAALILAAAMAGELTDEAGATMINTIQDQLRAALPEYSRQMHCIAKSPTPHRLWGSRGAFASIQTNASG